MGLGRWITRSRRPWGKGKQLEWKGRNDAVKQLDLFHRKFMTTVLSNFPDSITLSNYSIIHSVAWYDGHGCKQSLRAGQVLENIIMLTELFPLKSGLCLQNQWKMNETWSMHSTLIHISSIVANLTLGNNLARLTPSFGTKFMKLWFHLIWNFVYIQTLVSENRSFA